jgi:hypothetical protein
MKNRPTKKWNLSLLFLLSTIIIGNGAKAIAEVDPNTAISFTRSVQRLASDLNAVNSVCQAYPNECTGLLSQNRKLRALLFTDHQTMEEVALLLNHLSEVPSLAVACENKDVIATFSSQGLDGVSRQAFSVCSENYARLITENPVELERLTDRAVFGAAQTLAISERAPQLIVDAINAVRQAGIRDLARKLNGAIPGVISNNQKFVLPQVIAQFYMAEDHVGLDYSSADELCRKYAEIGRKDGFVLVHCEFLRKDWTAYHSHVYYQEHVSVRHEYSWHQRAVSYLSAESVAHQGTRCEKQYDRCGRWVGSCPVPYTYYTTEYFRRWKTENYLVSTPVYTYWTEPVTYWTSQNNSAYGVRIVGYKYDGEMPVMIDSRQHSVALTPSVNAHLPADTAPHGYFGTAEEAGTMCGLRLAREDDQDLRLALARCNDPKLKPLVETEGPGAGFYYYQIYGLIPFIPQ